ncbi:hypothetical protein [Robiginitalea marina]|uniref:DUF4488 domain-containing protein n=1 Tax=Robiginitalea marina TaxID=2954105 RepID=A0ABT1B1Q9_9FLAO|nr:hypothetical protein [Robiginitalea marina]MCO5725543.1 hypothetical protein [Robiginitalea marina]
MLRVLLIVLTLFSGVTLLRAQVGITTVLKEATIVGSAFKNDGWQQPVTLEYIDTEKGRRYRLYYQNEEYLGSYYSDSIIDIRSIYFYANEQELEYLYNFLYEGLSNPNRRELEIGDAKIITEITTDRNRQKGVVTCFVLNNDGASSYFRLTKKTLNRVFAK